MATLEEVMKMIVEHAKAGRNTEASQLFSQVFFQGERLHLDGDLATAEAVYTGLNQLGPGNPDLMHHLGVLKLQRGDREQGLDLINRAGEIKDKIDYEQYKARNGFPLYMFIQISRGCNLRCKMCAHEHWKVEKGLMEEGLYRHILDECKNNNIKNLQLVGAQGEPFLHPQVFDFIEMAGGNGFRVLLSTNGMPLNERKIKKLAQLKAGLVQFSFCGYDRESYEEYYTRAKFEKTVRNLKMLNEALNESGGNTVLQVNGVVPEGSAGFARKTLEFLKSIGIAEKHILLVAPNNFGGMMKCGDYNDEKRIYSHKRLDSYPLRMCNLLMTALGVYHDGRMTACGCIDANGALDIGDISREPLEDIVKGEKLKRIINAFVEKDIRKIPLCNKCDTPYCWHSNDRIFSKSTFFENPEFAL